jgi:TonB family protein
MLNCTPRKLMTGLSVLLLTAGFTANSAMAELNAPARIDPSYPHQQPPYPDSAQANGEQGTITLDVYVRPNGKPAKIKVAQSSGFEDLDNAAIEGVVNWRFIPALRDGDQVADWTTVKIVYQFPTMAPPPASAPSGKR